ncbi:AfsR/SARP family transcriptional regulator [Micromonospora sp. SD19]
MSALAGGGPDDPDSRHHVVIASDTLAMLLGTTTATVADTPRMSVTREVSDALTLIEEQTLHRARMCSDYEVDTLVELRDRDPTAEPVPPTVLIAAPTAAHERTRIAALLTQGHRLDIHGVLLGAWPDGDTILVAEDGSTSIIKYDVNQHSCPTAVGRLSVINRNEATELLRLLTESHIGDPQPPAPAQHTPLDRLIGAAHAPNPTPENSGAACLQERRDRAGNEPHPAGDDQSSRTGGRVDVRVLGEARIVNMDTTTPLRAKALELLVYLVVQDGDAAQDNILDDLLPDAPASKAPHRLHTYVSALRKTLALTGGPATYLTHPSRRYALNRDALDTDLWRMRTALRDADLATTDTDRTAALQRAVDAYDGTLADGFDYEWIEAYREGVRRQALDAHLALAAATTDPAQALTVLEAAMRHDPYAEAIYQHAMRAHAALGHVEQIRSLRRSLTLRLDEIDAEPSEDTLRLADQLIANLRRQKPTGKTDSHNNGLHP